LLGDIIKAFEICPDLLVFIFTLLKIDLTLEECDRLLNLLGCLIFLDDFELGAQILDLFSQFGGFLLNGCDLLDISLHELVSMDDLIELELREVLHRLLPLLVKLDSLKVEHQNVGWLLDPLLIHAGLLVG
jgi:hypothetical protein